MCMGRPYSFMDQATLYMTAQEVQNEDKNVYRHFSRSYIITFSCIVFKLFLCPDIFHT